MRPSDKKIVEVISAEEVEFMGGLRIIGHLAMRDIPKCVYSGVTTRANGWGRGPGARPGTGTVVDGGPRGQK